MRDWDNCTVTSSKKGETMCDIPTCKSPHCECDRSDKIDVVTPSKTVKVTTELPELNDYEYTGEYRAPKYGERYLNIYRLNRKENKFIEICDWNGTQVESYFIVKPKKWFPADREDYWYIDNFTGEHGVKCLKGEFMSGEEQRTNNYFKTYAEAKSVLKQMRGLLNNR